MPGSRLLAQAGQAKKCYLGLTKPLSNTAQCVEGLASQAEAIVPVTASEEVVNVGEGNHFLVWKIQTVKSHRRTGGEATGRATFRCQFTVMVQKHPRAVGQSDLSFRTE